MITWQPSDNPAADSVECFIATGTAAVIAAVTAASASTAKGVMDAKAAKKAAQIQATASDRAVAAQTSATDNALEFQKQQAALDADRQETNRHGNYDQWAAREGRVSTLGQMLGLPARDIPAYQPLPGTLGAQTGQTSNQAGGRMPAQGEVDWSASPDVLGQQLTAFYQKRGVAPSEVPYWVQHAQELVDRGRQLNDPAYADKRLAASEIFGGGGARSSAQPAAQTASYGTLAQPLTPAYVAPRAQMPGTLGSYGYAA